MLSVFPLPGFGRLCLSLKEAHLTAVSYEHHINTGVIAKGPGPSPGSEKPQRDGLIKGSFGSASLPCPSVMGELPKVEQPRGPHTRHRLPESSPHRTAARLPADPCLS